MATLKNNLFCRGSFSASSALANSLSLSNNLFWSVTGLAIFPADSSLWSVYNNLFDSCTLVRFPGTVDASGYNAYYHWNNNSRPSATRRRHPPERMDITQPGVLRSEQSWDERSTARDPDTIASGPQETPGGAGNRRSFSVGKTHDILLTQAIAYQSGPLGSFYQPTNSPLINKGSCTADLAGLYHYTVTTNRVNGLEIKETNSVVDIGLHYVAVDGSGNAIDSDAAGAPDYLENARGDGATNAVGETDWLNPSNDNHYLVKPGYLRCEYRVDPWGVDAKDPVTGKQKPRLYWIVSSGHRAAKQLAYQVLVATSTNNLALGNGDMWDSGQVLSDQTIHVEYNGSTLQSGQRLWWKVRSWDLSTGLASPWSTNGFFQMGLLNTNDWAGVKWISAKNYARGRPCPMYRKVIVLTNQIKNATAYVSAKGTYELWVNGHKIGPNVLAPEWTDYHKRIQYQTFELGPCLTNGTLTSTNVVGAIVGEGWFSGPGEVGNGACGDIGAPNPQFALLLNVTNLDNSVTNFATDATWAGFTNGAVRSSSIISGETIDANFEGFSPEWASPSYPKASLFSSAYLTNYSVTPIQMFAQPNDPIQISQAILPVAIWTVASNANSVAKVFDLGQLLSGVCTFVAATGGTNAGALVSLEHAEVLQLGQPGNAAPNGPASSDIYTGNLNGIHQLETFVLNGDDFQSFRPHFTYHAFRFVRVAAPPAIAAGLTTNSILAIATRSGVAQTGSFVCYDTNFANTNANFLLTNNPVSRLMTNISRTVLNNLQGVFTSCGGRNERNGYFYDEHIVSQTACFDLDMAAFLTKTTRDIRDAQLSSGQYSIYAPSALVYWPPGFADPGNAVGGIIFPWRLYQNYADIRMLKEHYLSASNWVSYATNQFPDRIWHERDSGGYNQFQVTDWMHAEWFSMFGAHPSGWSPGGLYGGMEGTNWGTVWYAYSADTLAAMSQALQQDALLKGHFSGANFYYAQVTNYEALAAGVRSAYTNLANDPNHWIKYDQNNNITNLFHNTQADCLAALFFNMVPDNQRTNILGILLKGPVGIRTFNSHFGSTYDLSTGYFFSSRAMLELTRDGYTDEAYRLLMDAAFPAWLYPVFHGFTTCWEGWNTYISGAGTDKGYYPNNSLSSFNHLPFGAVGEWIWEVVAGINLDDSNPGFKNVIIKPQPGGGITNAYASFNSIHGPITVSWTNDLSTTTFSVEATVPANATASIYLLGATNLDTITESGNRAINTSGLLAVPKVTNGAALFEVGSGSYRFKARVGL